MFCQLLFFLDHSRRYQSRSDVDVPVALISFSKRRRRAWLAQLTGRDRSIPC
jgi:hypothetical protein